MAKMFWLLYVFVGVLCLEQGLAQNNLHQNGKSVPDIAKRSVDEGPGDAVLEGISPVQKRAAVDEDVVGGRSIPHIRDIQKRSASNVNKGPVSKRSAKEGSANSAKPPAGSTNAFPHRRSVDDVIGNNGDGMPIPHIVQKRQAPVPTGPTRRKRNNKGPVSKRSTKEEPAHIVQKRDDDSGAPPTKPGNSGNNPLGGGGFTNALPHRRSVDDVLGNNDDDMPIPHIVQKRQAGEIAINDPPPPPRPPRS